MKFISVILITAILTSAATYTVFVLRGFQSRTKELHAVRDTISNNIDLPALSKDCLAMINKHPNISLVDKLKNQNAWLIVPLRLILLNPSYVHVDSSSLQCHWHQGAFETFGLTCRKDGSLWLHGSAIYDGPKCIYHQGEEKPNW